LAFISEFNVQLLYLPGLKNDVADFLSRPLPEYSETVAATAAADPVDFKEMAAEQNRCAAGQHSQTGAISTAVFRPIVPQKFRKDIFAHFHNVAHPGRLASCGIISSRFVWHGLSSDITDWIQKCLVRQRDKIQCHTCLAPPTLPHPTAMFFPPPC
jgi:hypothetical protein